MVYVPYNGGFGYYSDTIVGKTNKNLKIECDFDD
jgi:hypothetical protein